MAMATTLCGVDWGYETEIGNPYDTKAWSVYRDTKTGDVQLFLNCGEEGFLETNWSNEAALKLGCLLIEAATDRKTKDAVVGMINLHLLSRKYETYPYGDL